MHLPVRIGLNAGDDDGFFQFVNHHVPTSEEQDKLLRALKRLDAGESDTPLELAKVVVEVDDFHVIREMTIGRVVLRFLLGIHPDRPEDGPAIWIVDWMLA
jgi:hypothetical protein